MLTDWDLWSELSPGQRDYMNDVAPAPNTSQGFVWRLESLWVLLRWAFGVESQISRGRGLAAVAWSAQMSS